MATTIKIDDEVLERLKRYEAWLEETFKEKNGMAVNITHGAAIGYLLSERDF